MQRLRAATLLCALATLVLASSAVAQSKPEVPHSTEPRDGRQDFDFNLGSWKTHVKRLQHLLTGSKTWVEYDGTHVVRPIWDGRANLGEIKLDGPAGHLEGLSLRLYNPASHQWSLTFANPFEGTLSVPMVGEFKDGRGEFVQGLRPARGRGRRACRR